MTSATQANPTTRNKKVSIEGFFENISNPPTINNPRIRKRAIVCNTILTGSGNGTDDFSKIVPGITLSSKSFGSQLKETQASI
jgi:hypothetical protein